MRLEPGQICDETWMAEVRALEPGAQKQLLARADTLRGQDERAAYSCYRALHESLDDDQLVWLLRRLKHPDPDLEPAVRRAASAPAGTDLWFLGQLQRASADRAAGRLDAALERMLRVATRVRGPRQGVAYAKVSLLLGQAGRIIESLLLGQRAVALLEGSDLPDELARARLFLATAHVSLRDWTRVDAVMAAFDAALDSFPPADRAELERQRLILEMQAAAERGAFAHALTVVETMQDALPHHRAVLESYRRYLLVRLDRADEAPLEAEAPPGLELRFATSYVTQVVACETASAARKALARYYAQLESSPTPPGERLELLQQVLGTLEGRPELAAETKRAIDLAAAAMLERLGELHRFARSEDRLFELTQADRRELGRLKETFLLQQAELRQTVVRLFSEDESLHEAWYPENGLLALCAWCGRARHRDDTWVPVASFLPADRRLRLSHGICPECYEDEMDAVPKQVRVHRHTS